MKQSMFKAWFGWKNSEEPIDHGSATDWSSHSSNLVGGSISSLGHSQGSAMA